MKITLCSRPGAPNGTDESARLDPEFTRVQSGNDVPLQRGPAVGATRWCPFKDNLHHSEQIYRTAGHADIHLV